MTRKLTPAVLATAVILSLAAFAQTGSAAAKPAGNPAATPPAAAAAPAPAVATKVGIIDFQRAVVATNEGQREFEALAKKFDPTQQKLKTQSDEVENLKKQLQTQADKLNDEARAGLARTIDTKQKALQRDLEDAQGEAQREQNELFTKVGAKVYKTLEKYAQANGFSVILNYTAGDPQSPLLWAVPQVDVTKEVVDAYNKESGVAPPAAPARPVSSSKPAGTAPKPAPAPTTPKK